MSIASVTIAYDGPALREHVMDVRDLAPALLGVGQLFEAANGALNGDSARVKVQVRATEPGCFQITFEIVQTFGEQIVAFLSGPGVTAAANLVGLLTGGTAIGIGLFKLILLLKGGKLDKVDSLPSNMVRITFGDTAIEIPIELLKLYQNVAVRSAAQKVIEEPLKKEGIDSFDVRQGGASLVRVTKRESVYFAKPIIPDNTLVDDVRRYAFSIISLAFKEDNKWRLNDGNNPISATIEDPVFLEKVDANQVSFSKGDILICDVRVVQKQTDSGLKTDYTVVHVLEHRTGTRQLPLPFHRDDPPSLPGGTP